ncbi:MAG TPA: NAD-dependent epimerase/dehydratase family protein [Actinomycetota bacterium]|jgi:dTDP-L-rhamnose 4-epimerase
MAGELVLITGGAGFIGSHTADRLLELGYRVRVLDALIPQVHGEDAARPAYLNDEVELRVGDVRDPEAVDRALAGATYVYHLAADTGVGQSMYALQQYFSTNVLGTSLVWERIQRRPGTVGRVVLSSSRAVYGEGRYWCRICGDVFPGQRSEARLLRGDWWHYCPNCSRKLEPRPSAEDSPARPVSVYGLTKKMQEDTCNLMGGTLGVPVSILRYFNVYGPRQSLTNPYTGLIPTFSTRLRLGRPVFLYEEGIPWRDFVHVDDVVRANVAAIAGARPPETVNVGSGTALSLRDVVEALCGVLGGRCVVERTTKFRLGDILGCYAGLETGNSLVGSTERVSFRDGLRSLLPWLETSPGVDRSEEVEAELRARGVLKEGGGGP